MRITISLDDDLYRQAKSLAAAEDYSISRAINTLLRKKNPPPSPGESKLSNFPVSASRKPFTSEDVRKMEEEELK